MTPPHLVEGQAGRGGGGRQGWNTGTHGFYLSGRAILKIGIHCQCLKSGHLTSIPRILASLDDWELGLPRHAGAAAGWSRAASLSAVQVHGSDHHAPLTPPASSGT